jgi:hypothetical protein
VYIKDFINRRIRDLNMAAGSNYSAVRKNDRRIRFGLPLRVSDWVTVSGIVALLAQVYLVIAYVIRM